MASEIRENNYGMGHGGSRRGTELTGMRTSGPGSAGAQRHRQRKIRVEVEIPEALMGEFDLAVQEGAGPRTRLTLLEQSSNLTPTGLPLLSTDPGLDYPWVAYGLLTTPGDYPEIIRQ
jgi:hypothetical protein